MPEPENGPGSPIPVGKTRYWLPTSLRRLYLSSLAALFILMAIAIEVIRQYSKRHHGLIHLKSYEELARFTSGVYTYIPTAFAILAVALWNICALDVLRLEPYFQLAKPEGAPGDILFTNYCFFYGIMAPIMAFRNRHWIVTCVSSTSIILRVMLPSIMSGLVNLDEINRTSARHLDTWPNLMSPAVQDNFFSKTSYNQVNGTSSALETVFSYQIHNYSMPPVSMPVHSRPGASTWKLDQDIYWSNVSCMETHSIDVFPTKLPWNDTSSSSYILNWKIDNLSIPSPPGADADSKCEVSISLNSTYAQVHQLPHILQWETLDSRGDSSVASAFSWNRDECQDFALFGLSIDADNTWKKVASKATVLACKPNYFRTRADIILPANSTMAHATNISDSELSLTSTELDIAGFRKRISSQFYQNGIQIGENSNSNVASSVIYFNNTMTYLEPNRFNLARQEQEISRLWNRGFITLIDQFFNTTTDPERVRAKHTTLTVIYAVNSRTALIAEALMLVVSLLLMLMSVLYPLRPNFLLSDPGSIAAQCALITDMFPSLNPITDADVKFDQASPRQLRHFSRSLWCRFIDGPTGKYIEITHRQGQSTSVKTQVPPKKQRNSRPHFLTPLWFLLECLLMAGVLAAFGISFQFIRLDKLDTSDSAGTTIIWLFLDYGPTVIASMISSLFVSVHRHIGSIEPWVRLREGMALSKDSLAVNFGSYTPLTVWSQFREKKPPLLIILSVICILDFGLTIASTGMFEPSVDKWKENTQAITTLYNTSSFGNPQLRTDFSGTTLISDVLSMGRPLLSWSAANISFYPLGINDPSAEYMDMSIYTSRTRGVGVELQCEPASHSHNSSRQSFWTYNLPGSENGSTCSATLQHPALHDIQPNPFNGSLYFGNVVNSSHTCQKSFVVGWKSEDVNLFEDADEFSGVFYCAPTIMIRDFKVNFDLNGVISRYQPILGSSITSGEMFQNVSNGLLTFNDAFTRHAQIPNSWNTVLISQVYNILEFNSTANYASRPNRHSNRLSHSYLHKSIQQTATQRQDLFIRTLQLAYQTAFSSHISLQRDAYLTHVRPSKSTSTHVPAVVTSAVWYVTPSNATIGVIIAFLSIDLAVLMGVFWLRHGHYSGPPFPRSIGSLIPWITHSRLLNDVRGTSSWSEEKRTTHLKQLGHRYRFGDFGGSHARVALDHDEKSSLHEEGYELDQYRLSRQTEVAPDGVDRVSPPA
ncbi:hypothetical protein PENSTE_c006G02761 [Penicillium steckii]|uniref:Uncharacterized protein n=1 Tax=Penicillium steckii TaxID=303698 RepID=A0A1V6TG06_9EURO|nr:hypothetical protein PENSTE_c006G02761 [Penicillium steckii]